MPLSLPFLCQCATQALVNLRQPNFDECFGCRKRGGGRDRRRGTPVDAISSSAIKTVPSPILFFFLGGIARPVRAAAPLFFTAHIFMVSPSVYAPYIFISKPLSTRQAHGGARLRAHA